MHGSLLSGVIHWRSGQGVVASDLLTGWMNRCDRSNLLVAVGFLAEPRSGNLNSFPDWVLLAAVGIGLFWLEKRALAGLPYFLRRHIRALVALLFFFGFVRFIVWAPLWWVLHPFGLTEKTSIVVLLGIAIPVWILSSIWIYVSRPRRAVVTGSSQQPVSTKLAPYPASATTRDILPAVPALRFADVGGMEGMKQQISELVKSRLNCKKYKRYGVVKNGILLHGCQGGGKSHLAEATAGEFGLRFYRVSPLKLVDQKIGATAENIRYEFARAAANTPALLFLDELDALGTARQASPTGGDPGGGGRELNNAVVQLMECVAEYRATPGFVYAAATNRLDALDEALTRDERWDLKLRVDRPDEQTREKIFEVQFLNRPWRRFDLKEFARDTPGATAARIKLLVNQAALIAAEQNRLIETRDLRRALEQSGGTDRPLFETVQWEDLVVEDGVEKDLRTLIRLLEDREVARKTRVGVPTGLVLVGPTGTGKGMIARLIATQTRRSYYPIAPADVLGGNVGESVKLIRKVFVRARENSPSLIFLDEMDSLFPDRKGILSQHDVQLVDQFLIEVSALEPNNNVFLVGATNHPENVDRSVLGGHRFSDKWQIGVPGPEGCQKLLRKYLADVQLEAGAAVEQLAQGISGFAPADIEAICAAAKRFAFGRMGEAPELPPLSSKDFEEAVKRVRGQY